MSKSFIADSQNGNGLRFAPFNLLSTIPTSSFFLQSIFFSTQTINCASMTVFILHSPQILPRLPVSFPISFLFILYILCEHEHTCIKLFYHSTDYQKWEMNGIRRSIKEIFKQHSTFELMYKKIGNWVFISTGCWQVSRF